VKAPRHGIASYLAALFIFGPSAPSIALDIDRVFYGFYDLNVTKSALGSNPALKMGMVSWNRNGPPLPSLQRMGTSIQTAGRPEAAAGPLVYRATGHASSAR
jgi:hypothetical protein